MNRILVVDDEDIQRRSMVLLLRRAGFTVEAAGSGGEALAKLAEGGYDAVLVDLMMPKLNGLEFARIVRARFPRVGVVLTSAYPLSRQQIERLGLGTIAFVPKPISLPELDARLRESIANAEHRNSTVMRNAASSYARGHSRRS